MSILFFWLLLTNGWLHSVLLGVVVFQSGACPDGHFCPQGTGDPYTFPCRAGHFRNNTLGHSGEACVLCPSRHYCLRPGTQLPEICPQVEAYLNHIHVLRIFTSVCGNDSIWEVLHGFSCSKPLFSYLNSVFPSFFLSVFVLSFCFSFFPTFLPPLLPSFLASFPPSSLGLLLSRGQLGSSAVSGRKLRIPAGSH